MARKHKTNDYSTGAQPKEKKANTPWYAGFEDDDRCEALGWDDLLGDEFKDSRCDVEKFFLEGGHL